MKYIILLALISTGISCSSDSGDSAFFEDHQWMMVTATTKDPIDINNRGIPSSDLYSQYAPCSLDDIVHFKPKGVLISDENNAVCMEPKIRNGSWTLKGDSLIMNFDFQNVRLAGKIQQLSPESFRLTVN